MLVFMEKQQSGLEGNEEETGHLTSTHCSLPPTMEEPGSVEWLSPLLLPFLIVL